MVVGCESGCEVLVLARGGREEQRDGVACLVLHYEGVGLMGS